MAYDGTLNFDTSVNTSGFQKDANNLGDIVKGMGVFKIIEKGFQAITASIDNAVSRYDTLNRFPKIMEQIGFSADKADASMQKLSDGVTGLPTALDEIVGSAQRVASMTGDLEGAADITLALNNAFLASGASSDAASRGMEQYMQIIGRGKPEMEDWKTLQETMPYALQKVAESFGYAGTSATRDFYAALQSGEITVEQMNARFVELSTAAEGFAETAKTATGGIGTAFTNMRTAITRGVAKVVESIDKGLSKTRFKSIENIVESTGKGIESVLKAVAQAFGFVAENADVILPIVTALSVAFVTLKAKAAIESVFRALSVAFKLAAAQAAALATGSTAAASAMVFQTTAQKALTIAVAAGNVIKTAAIAVMGLFTGSSVAATGATLTLGGALHALGTAVYAALGPFGLVLVVIVAITAAIIGLGKVLGSGTEKYKKQKEEVEALTAAQKELSAETEKSETAYASATAEISASGKAAKNLVGVLKDVSSGTANTTEKHSKMASTVDQLNAAVEGLNIAYDEETGAIRNINSGQEISIDQLEKLIDAKSELAKANAWQERKNELVQEQVKIEEELALIEEKKAEILRDSNLSTFDQQVLLRELEESADGYASTMTDVEMRLDVVNQNIAESNSDAAESVVSDYERMEQAITENGESIDDIAARWGVSVESIKSAWNDAGGSFDEFVTAQEDAMEEYQESVAAHTDEVINSFKEIPSEYEMTAQEMIDILHTNRERYAEWRQAMVEISGQVSAETLAELEKLGPGALSAINEMRENGGEGLRAFDEEIRATVSESSSYATQAYNDPAFTGAPSAAFDTAAKQVTENTSLTTAVTTQMEDARDAAEKVDFTEVGKNIASDIVSGLNSADVSGAMNGIASEIRSGSGCVTSAVTHMSSSVQGVLRTMSGQSRSIATQMMTQISSAIVTKTATVKASTTSCANGVITVLADMKTKGGNLASQMMMQINSAVVTKTATVKASSTSLANGVVRALEPMGSGGTNAAGYMMDGMWRAMNNKAGSLYAKAREIANRISATLRSAWDEHSPSRVSYKIMEYFMQAMYNAMGDMSGLLYTKADSVADGLTDRLTLEPGTFTGMVDRLRSVTEANLLGGATLVPQAAHANAGGGTQYVTNLNQNITTPKPLSASEMTREGQDMLRRYRWQLP